MSDVPSYHLDWFTDSAKVHSLVHFEEADSILQKNQVITMKNANTILLGIPAV